MNSKKREAVNLPEGFDSLSKSDTRRYSLLEENRALKDEVRELQLRLAKNSSNSNNLLSTDPLK